jgi:DNA-binding transcriptional MerR regulator
MPVSEPDKRYYSIGEVAARLEVNASLIRFWEKEFPQIQPKKTESGSRKYRPQDLELLEKIYALVKVRGFTLEGARKMLKRKGSEEERLSELEARLLSLKQRLEELRELL